MSHIPFLKNMHLENVTNGSKREKHSFASASCADSRDTTRDCKSATSFLTGSISIVVMFPAKECFCPDLSRITTEPDEQNFIEFLNSGKIEVMHILTKNEILRGPDSGLQNVMF